MQSFLVFLSVTFDLTIFYTFISVISFMALYRVYHDERHRLILEKV